MKDKKHRFGLKEPGKPIKKILFSKKKEDAAHFGIRGADYHFTWINEKDSISIHKTNHKTGKQTPLGKVSKSMSEEEADNIILEALNVKPVTEKDKTKVVLCITDKFLELTEMPDDIAKKKTETGNEIIEYYDIDEMNKYNIQKLQEINGIEDLLSWGTVEDIINDKYPFGMTENYTFIGKFDDELYELDVMNFQKSMFTYDENSPLSRMLATLGIYDIVRDSQKYLE